MSLKPQSFLRILTLFTIAILMLSNVNTISAVPGETENLCSGPYVDKVMYQIYENENTAVLELQGSGVDAIHYSVSSSYVSTLEADPDIEVHTIPEDQYACIDINCQEYPLNITGLRQAFAYAFDKTDLVSDLGLGSAFEHDSVLPAKDELCIEEDLPFHYYSNQSEIGNQILDNLNFVIDGGTGWRLAPDGNPFVVDIIYLGSDTASTTVMENAVDTLYSLRVESNPIAMELYEFVPAVANHADHGMAINAFFGNVRDLDWILDNYHSSTSSAYYMNPSGYENDTFDTLAEETLDADTYVEFLDAVTEIQEHLHESVPVLVLYHEIEHQAYKTSDFAGYVDDDWWGIPGHWTNVKVHQSTGSVFGGIFKIAISHFPTTFNIFNLGVKGANILEQTIVNNLYSSLYKKGPDGTMYPDLAKTILVETHSTNSMVPVGQTWVTFDIREDAVWSDGEPLNAEDVAFTFNYIEESKIYGNPIGFIYGWGDAFFAAYPLEGNGVRVALNGNSYYHIQQLLEVKIIPEHIFNDATGIGYAGWDDWDPVISLTDPHVTCGPFYVSSDDLVSLELTRNMDYHWLSGLTPKILSSADVDYVQGTTGNQIVWEVTDEDPNDFTIYRNDSLVVTDDWNGSNIIHNVDGLSVGLYNYTLVLTDISGHIVTDTVWVTVSSSGVTELPDMLIMGIAAGSSIVIIVAVVLIYKRR